MAEDKVFEAKQIKHEIITYRVKCPSCGGRLEADSSLAGIIIECLCGAEIKVVKYAKD